MKNFRFGRRCWTRIGSVEKKKDVFTVFFCHRNLEDLYLVFFTEFFSFLFFSRRLASIGVWNSNREW